MSGVCRWPRKHVWEIHGMTTQQSPIEILQASGLRRFRGYDDSFQDLATRPVIVTRICKRCGLEEVRRV